ncbi:MAG: hypothetical protein JRI59_09720 [Deltaproteobacteria bacterium]|nr:hypothetical protein [Deltaproteobacteria bacterium]
MNGGRRRGRMELLLAELEALKPEFKAEAGETALARRLLARLAEVYGTDRAGESPAPRVRKRKGK